MDPGPGTDRSAGTDDLETQLSNLGVALRIRSEHTGELSDLDEAIALSRRQSLTPTPTIPIEQDAFLLSPSPYVSVSSARARCPTSTRPSLSCVRRSLTPTPTTLTGPPT